MTTDDRDAPLPQPRAAVRGLPLYAPDVAASIVDVSENVNLWGSPPASLRALASAPAERVNRYPSLYSTTLRDAVLGYLGLSSANGIGLVTGCGSDDVLDAAIRAFGEPGDEVAFAAPTFVMIPIFTRLNGLVPALVPMGPNYEVDPQQLVDRRARITYLCTPNNPTSTAMSRAAVEYVVERAAGLVVLDEAYAEFAPDVFTARPRKRDNWDRTTASCASSSACQSRSPISATRRVESTMSVNNTVASTRSSDTSACSPVRNSAIS